MCSQMFERYTASAWVFFENGNEQGNHEHGFVKN